MTAEEAMQQKIRDAENTDAYEQANAPFISKSGENVDYIITKPSAESENVKTLVPFQTKTFLDNIFLDAKDKPISGLPFGSNSLITGLPNSGKSLFMEEIALRVAESERVCYVTSEEAWSTKSQRLDLENRMREKAKILELSWEKIRSNLFVLDAVSHAELRDWYNFGSAYCRLVEKKEGVKMLLVDSITMLEDSRGQLKYRLSGISKYNQLQGVTSIMVNQRSVAESDTLAMAGGISLSHIVDIVMVLDYKKVWTGDGQMKLDTGAKQGRTINFFRALKCRICKFDAHYFAYRITDDGILKLISMEEMTGVG